MSDNRLAKQALIIGAVFILLGLVFLLNNMGLLALGDLILRFWPLLLIAVGVFIIYKSFGKDSDASPITFGDQKEVSTDNYVTFSNTFGDSDIIIDNQQFKGGSLKTSFGELHVDLAKAKLESGDHILDLSVTFGEIFLSVPKELPVRVTATNVAGDIRIGNEKWEGINKRADWKSEKYDSASARLEIHCSIVFGEIKVM